MHKPGWDTGMLCSMCLLISQRVELPGREGLLAIAQDQAILDQIQRRVGEERLQQRIEEQRRKSWIKRS
jgi:hypothetical protein